MAAVAIVKDSSWAEKKIIPSPKMEDMKWIENPNNPRKIIVWKNFNSEKIIDDFF